MADSTAVYICHVSSSLGPYASQLARTLRNNKIPTYIRLTSGADAVSSSDLQAAINCKVLIAFIDEDWAHSSQCLTEFNAAFSCYVKSGRPRMLPLAFGSIDWIDPVRHPDTHVITANFHCLIKETPNWMEFFTKTTEVVKKLISEVDREFPTINLERFDRGSDFVELITCDICSEQFKDPRLLPCGHTFCRECIEDWYSMKSYSDMFDLSLECPKCRQRSHSAIESLQPDFRAKRLMEILQQQMDSGHDESTSNKVGLDSPDALSQWFSSNSVPEILRNQLIENGYDCLDIILDMNEDDMREIDLKPGHIKKLMTCIEASSKPDIGNPNTSVFESATPSSEYQEPYSTPNWSLIEDLYDEDILCSGSCPSRPLKFWAKLGSQVQFNNMVEFIQRQAVAVETHASIGDSEKCDCLLKAAGVLACADCFEAAEKFIDSAKFYSQEVEKKVGDDLKAMNILVTFGCLKQPSSLVTRKKNRHKFDKLLSMCDEFIHNGGSTSEAKLCKVYITRACTCLSMMWFCDPAEKSKLEYLATDAVNAAIELATVIQNDGLRAEALMALGDIYSAQDPEKNKGLPYLKDAWRLSQKTFGEHSILTACIYYDLGIGYEHAGMRNRAYQCFRRTWIIAFKLLGPYHPRTKKAATVIESRYFEEAKQQGDLVPSDSTDIEDTDPESRLPWLFETFS